MPVRLEALGHVERVGTQVSARWCLAFAASLGFDGAAYMDDSLPGGPMVPPCFCVGPEWLLAGGEGRIAALGVTGEERRRAVHVLQGSEFHRPFAIDRAAVVVARIAEIRATSAGAYVMTLLETRDAETDALIVTSRSAVIFRGVPVEGGRADGPVDADVLPARPATPTLRWTVDTAATLPHIYSECARIWNPIHTERLAARAAGLPDIILHGTATWGLAMRQIIAEAAVPHVAHLRRFTGRFRAPVAPGSRIVIEAARHPAGGGYHFAVLNDAGEVAISHGLAAFGAP